MTVPNGAPSTALPRGKVIVAVIPSYSERYLSTLLAEEARQHAQSLPVTPVDPRRID